MLKVNTRITTKNLIDYIKLNINQLTDEKCLSRNKESNSDVNNNYDSVNKVSHNFFPLKVNLDTKLDFIGNDLDDILTQVNEDFYRVGVLSNIDDLEETDVSLYSSILWLLKNDFSDCKRKEQSKYIYEFIKMIKLESQSVSFDKFNYKSMGWTKKQLLEDVKSQDIKTTVIRYLADYLHINIFILNVTDGKLYYVGTDEWVTYKKNLLLIKHNNNFEPVYTSTNKYFLPNSKLVSFLTSKPYIVNIMNCDFINNTEKEFHEGKDELDNYISDNPKLTDKNNTLNEESEAMNQFEEGTSENSEEDDEDNDLDYSKMSYTEIKKIASDYDIHLYYIKDGKKKKKSKSMIIKDIEKNKDKPDYSTYRVVELRELALECGLNIKNKKKFKLKSVLLEELDEYYS
jgi:hypothetical protein